MKNKINSVTQKEFLPRTFSLKKTVNKTKTGFFKNYIEDYHKKDGKEKLEEIKGMLVDIYH